MKLLELYENLFQYVCRLNRAAKTPAHPEYVRVRSEIKELFNEVDRNASGDVRLHNQIRQLELSMIFFVDNLICTSRLKFAGQWAENRMAKERNELARPHGLRRWLMTTIHLSREKTTGQIWVNFVFWAMSASCPLSS